MSKDDDLIRRMTETYLGDGSALFQSAETGMSRVLAVVREHDAPAAKRVPVQVVYTSMPGESSSFVVLANDGTLHTGRYDDGDFSWREELPPLPQPGDEP